MVMHTRSMRKQGLCLHTYGYVCVDKIMYIIIYICVERFMVYVCADKMSFV